jgi:hypothetical protein
MEGFALPFFITILVTFNFGSIIAQSTTLAATTIKMDVVMDVKTTNTKAHKNSLHK